MLVKTVLTQFSSNIKLVYEDFGESALTERYQITGYPAVFVNELPVLLPQDLGYFGAGDDAKYKPWADPTTQQRFAEDFNKILRLATAGALFDEYVREASDVDPYPARLPSMTVTDSQGETIDLNGLTGRVVIVDFWATWCPPCRRTLPEMESLQARFGDRLAIMTVCVGSPDDQMKKVGAELAPNLPTIPGTDEVIASFGNVISVPTLMVFDADGKRREVFIGAPEDLPTTLETLIEGMLQ